MRSKRSFAVYKIKTLCRWYFLLSVSGWVLLYVLDNPASGEARKCAWVGISKTQLGVVGLLTGS